MHDMPAGKFVFPLGVAGLLATFFSWFSNIVKEAHAGHHTPVVQLHLRYGMILFIASEVMFFVGWFWAFFDFSLFPSTLSEEVAGQWPPKAIEAVLDAFDLPLLNTLILLCSGTTVTWAHHSLIHGDRDGLKKGLWATILLGLLFTSIQAYEYAAAPFPFGDEHLWFGVLHGDGLPRLPRHHRHDLPDRLPQAHLQRRFHAAPALRLRSRRLVLALRRRGVAVPVRLDLRLGQLGRAGPLRAAAR
jgi:hypothetical protein